MKYKCIFLMLIIFGFVFCSCSNLNEESEGTTTEQRIIKETIVLETINDSDFVAEELNEPPFEVSVPEYELTECDFSVDEINHRITACYDDTDLYGSDGYVINYDVDYHDYGVESVSCYRVEQFDVTSNVLEDFEDSSYQLVLDNMQWAINWGEGFDDAFNQMTLSNVTSCQINESSDNEFATHVIDTLSSEFSFHQSLLCYNYQMPELMPYFIMGNADVSGDPGFIMGFDGVSPLGYAENDILRMTLRTDLNGLPIGLPTENAAIFECRKYDEIYGSVGFPARSTIGSLYSSEYNALIDVVSYAYSKFQPVDNKENLPVIPLEDCIQNSLPGALYCAHMNYTNECFVYAAELIYYPFIENCSDIMNDINHDVYYLPFWAVYVVTSDGPTNSSVILLNAYTGELVSYGL